jgi:hypothetical protein
MIDGRSFCLGLIAAGLAQLAAWALQGAPT